MTGNCFKNNVIREGASRQLRLPDALKKGFVKIDERNFQELLDFVIKISDEFIYTNEKNEGAGGWSEFFNQKLDETGYTAPHFALFSIFLELFSIAQTELNDVGDRHTGFFYTEVLGFSPTAPIPDTVYLIGELAKHIAAAQIETTELFKTGIKVDTLVGTKSEKIEKLYGLTSAVAFNKTRIQSISNLFVKNNFNLFASEIANSEDGVGGESTATDKSWSVFGDETRPQKTFGFGIESPILRMAEGTRKVTLTINTNLTAASNTAFSPAEFQFLVSGEKGWIVPDTTTMADPISLSSGVFELSFECSAAQESIVSPTTDLHGLPFNQNHPVVQICFATSGTNTACTVLNGAGISSCTIKVDVKGLNTFIVQNENGVLDAAKPIQPFGSLPKLGSKFYIGSNELFSKTLSSVILKMKWRDKPADFNTYYANYDTKPASGFGDASFKINTKYRDAFQWKNGITNANMFTLDSSPIYKWELINSSVAPVPRGVNTDVKDRCQTDTERGYFQIELAGSDFFHDDFQRSYAKGILLGINETTDKLKYVPNNPYTPECESLSLDYIASETVNLFAAVGDTAFEQRVERWYHLGPFGISEQHNLLNINTATTAPIIPEFAYEGELYLGLDQSVVPQNFTFLVQVSDGSSDPDLDAAEVTWDYLSNNHWIPFEKTQILAEQTLGFLKTGLISISLPSAANNTNTWMPTGLVWLRARVTNNSAAVCRIINLHAQAAEAKFYAGSALQPTGDILPAETISKLKNPRSEFKKFSQPYSSFGGSGTESDEDFHTRVSERLRHKRRAITVWDYERIVLQEFKDIYKVKAINHTRYNGTDGGYQSLKPGWTTVIVVPDTYNKNAIDPYRPRVSNSTRTLVSEFLKKHNSPHVNLEVQNPIYEEIKLHLEVKFHNGEDVGICTELLHTKINELLAPWAFSNKIEIGFGGMVHKSSVIYHIEKLEYVDFVQCVKMYQIAPAWLGVNEAEDRDFATATTMASVFTTSNTHQIQALDLDLCDCINSSENLVTGTVFNETEDCGCIDK